MLGNVPPLMFLLTLDNLDGQLQLGFANALRRGGCLRWMLPPDCTDLTQPVDAGIGLMLRLEIGRQCDKWMWVDANLERWEGSMTASERRVLMTEWVGEAWKVVMSKHSSLFSSYERVGGLMTADSSEDDKIKIEGLVGPYKFHGAQNPNPPPDVNAEGGEEDPWQGVTVSTTHLARDINLLTNELEKVGMVVDHVDQWRKATVVVCVQPGSPAALAHIVAGDKIVGIGDVVCESLAGGDGDCQAFIDVISLTGANVSIDVKKCPPLLIPHVMGLLESRMYEQPTVAEDDVIQPAQVQEEDDQIGQAVGENEEEKEEEIEIAEDLDAIPNDIDMIFAVAPPDGFDYQRVPQAARVQMKIIIKFPSDEGGWRCATVRRSIAGHSSRFVVMYEDTRFLLEEDLSFEKYGSVEDSVYKSWCVLKKKSRR